MPPVVKALPEWVATGMQEPRSQMLPKFGSGRPNSFPNQLKFSALSTLHPLTDPRHRHRPHIIGPPQAASVGVASTTLGCSTSPE
jgi:hypothetical protein